MTRFLSPFWLVSASLALSFSWLLPNHSIPWLSFHGDSWSAFILLFVSTYVILKSRFKIEWYYITLFAFFTILIPVIQYFFGLIVIFGVAWINATYLLGFVLTMLVGSIWEKNQKNQAGDFLFLAIAMASIVSIGLQLHQFFHMDSIDPWILRSSGARHFANMAQPNQLGSLLLLGTLACGWGYSRKVLSSVTAIGIAAIFLFGTVLTESRTVWLNVLLLLGVTIIWRKLLPSRFFLWSVLGLCVFFVVCSANLSVINSYFDGGLPVEYRQTVNDPRWTAWIMFFKAVIHQPFAGFGWGQLGHAQFLMMDQKISFGGSFLQAHNLFIDLILWNGIPIGVTISIALVLWVWSAINKVVDFSQLLLMCFLLVLGTHAMLEYPLQYAYFLLPTGMVIGSLNFSLGFRSIRVINKKSAIILLMISYSIFAITVRDYFRIENSFYGLRFEQKKIASDYPRTPPDVLALTQWRDYIVFARMQPHSGVSNADLEWMRNLVSTTPSAFVMYRFAAMLVLNDKAAEATLWLKRLCQTSPKEQCEAIRIEWEIQSTRDPNIARIPWPN